MHEGESVSGAMRLQDIIAAPIAFTPADQSEPRKLLTGREAAKVLGVCDKTLWAMTNRGEMPAVRRGRSVRYDPADLNQWIASNKSRGPKCSAAV